MHVVSVDGIYQCVDDAVTALKHRHDDHVGQEDASVGNLYHLSTKVQVMDAKFIEPRPRLDKTFETISRASS